MIYSRLDSRAGGSHMGQVKHRVAIVGCGSMGQIYADAYSTYPDCEIVAIAEYNPDRLRAVGEKYGVKALYKDVNALLRDNVPDIVAVITPTKHYKEAVLACAQAGVKGVSTDKPIAATLSDADEMVRTCEELGVVYAGGNLMRALPELHEAARRIRAGEYGDLVGAAVHRFRGEIIGGGCQQISVLRLLTGAEVDEVIAWGHPPEALARQDDEGLAINGRFHMTSGLECQVFGTDTSLSWVDVWSEEVMVSSNVLPPVIYKGYDESGARVRIDSHYAPYEWSEFGYLTGSIRSLLATVDTGSELAISGHDLRQALEVAIAAKQSALLGSVPVKLPLEDRSLTLYPRAGRWLGRDVIDLEHRDKLIWGKR
jgi:predicted dehydrogenase